MTYAAKHALSRDQAREIDERAVQLCGMAIETLMENAGGGCARTLLSIGVAGPVAIVCGKGNNAGDGFVMARHLDLAGVDVTVAQCAPATDLSSAAATNFQLLAHTGVRLAPVWQWIGGPMDKLRQALDSADWKVDALFGVGLQGPLRPPYDQVVEAMNAAGGRKLAIDIPSGMDCDTGEPRHPTFRADHTFTFVAPKLGFQSPAAKPYLGEVHVLDIGAPRKLIESVLESI
jgi:NAD(P)H-hydrate epimerase